LVALSTINRDKEITAYYNRKVNEGKNKQDGYCPRLGLPEINNIRPQGRT